ncbi:MAG: B12-binding domain-containing radical SAM protein [Pseudomonadota bacterium]|nr:B12-binding domain-containing radical SAM protein [Pseudomonadota bacterium]MEC8996774.1 B12-binding domain-containing radical SAM protein [Pseudomonadota bacterium]|tara:strand:- start:1014 stop:3074 length:2061 start_codon:yes stop_codon:yes gene_type:complete
MKTDYVLKGIGNRHLNIMLGDFCYFNRHTLHERYTPLGIGLIGQYTKQQFGEDVEISLYKSVDKFLEKATEKSPDVIGLSVYYWNMAQNQYVVKKIREMYGKNVIIVLGGPSIDNEVNEQRKFLSVVFPEADAVIINEGEIGFTNIIKKIFDNKDNIFKDSIDGISFLNGDQVIQGLAVGTSIDLSTVGSPYLSGLMDEFMDSDYQPLIQTSRFCPYTCAFCVSGKLRGKLRGYPIEQVIEELKYVSKKYADRPHHTMFIADENFGILKRDVEIAEAVKKCNVDYNYPRKIFFYNDKRFKETSRKVIEILGDINQGGLVLSLQTENPETLKAINRRNVSEEEIDDAISWASKLNISTSTELIFGMPHDTRDSFVELLDRSVKRGFDQVWCHNLFLMDGIELNRPDAREKFGIKTKFRQLGTNYGMHGDSFFGEYEEVVVSCNSFSYKDFLEIRNLNFMYYAVFSLNFQKWFFHFIRNSGIQLSEFFLKFINPDRNAKWPSGYLKFLDDLKAAIEGELHNNREEVIEKARKTYIENNNDVGDPSRINVNLGARLIYQEDSWIKDVLIYHLNTISKNMIPDEAKQLAASLIDLADNERIDLKNITEKKPMNFSYDVIAWRQNKFKKPLYDLKMPTKSINFLLDENRTSQIDSFQKRFGANDDNDFYYAAMDFITPRSCLTHILSYDNE